MTSYNLFGLNQIFIGKCFPEDGKIYSELKIVAFDSFGKKLSEEIFFLPFFVYLGYKIFGRVLKNQNVVYFLWFQDLNSA